MNTVCIIYSIKGLLDALMTNYNKTAVFSWSVSQSQHHATPVGHVSWQLFS